ncbi:MAG: OmpH family outer membrane protein [Gammaproteobacteria bacterium]|nr:OmpH family outer membrane protein [Gammaproteobacteria bacterium]NIR85423.1 OmpH family outer membrane protein [Gammaproteobacteria bacterium]NIR89350.1 OmpH family outer membrane protein [Gammaproteobacteria bacterium]NIU02807.1 OmpH family outer membrane protein [Gammaproteobacteria bacterium]NIV50331.1 OmpH family outer membrane protein [Gammaproteobacteria bacterium]
MKVGFVNPAKVLENAPQAKEAREQLEQEFAPRERKLSTAETTLREMEERLKRDGAVMKESERRELEREILAERRELKRDQQAFKEDLNIRRNEETRKLQRQLYQTIVSMAEREGYDLIVTDGVVFASERVDITDKVLERLKERHRAGSAGGQ